MSVLLALDSSTEIMSLALVAGQELLCFESEGGPQASEQMVPQALSLLAKAGLRLQDVDAIAFGRGPGAFTGLRTACAVAQGLALGADKPVLAIDSLMIPAEDAWQQLRTVRQTPPETIWVAMDARMNEIYAASYARQGSAWRTVHEPALYAPPALQACWLAQPPHAVAGTALNAFDGQLPLADDVARWPTCQSRASALAELARQAWSQGLCLDAAQALPVYVRDKVAQTTAERLASAGGRA